MNVLRNVYQAKFGAVIVLLLLSGCSWFRPSAVEADLSPTLAQLPAASDHLRKMREASAAVDNTDQQALLVQVSQAYHAALELAEDPEVRQEILQRLAHIDLQIAEERQINDANADPKQLYGSAIESYQALLTANASATSQAQDQLLYPLAKAHEMSGDIPAALKVFDQLVTETPQSQYYSESQFRRAEILFAAGDYAAASQAYRAVISRAEENTDTPAPFLLNSWYMAGWSDFKLGRYTQALKAFFVVMDSQTQSAPLADELASSQQALIDDTLRVMSLSFSYELGPATIAQLLDERYEGKSEPAYVDQLYANLAELYLQKKRFADSAGSYLAYIERYPVSRFAPDFHVQMIAVYAQAGFIDKVRAEKEHYVAAYGVRSDYWVQADSAQRESIQQELNIYIHELASYYHNLAQTTKLDGENLSPEQVRDHYRAAGRWYEEWIASVPESPYLDRIWFLLGETRFESQEYAAAITAYENAAYGVFPLHSAAQTETEQAAAQPDDEADSANRLTPFDQHSDAAYAALLAYDQLIAVAESEALSTWQRDKNDSALVFASTFPDDARANPVLAQAVESLFALQQYEKTVEVGQGLVAKLEQSAVDGRYSDAESEQFFVGTGLAVAHARRELAQHNEAELAYLKVLNHFERNANSALYRQYHDATLDNYAASIYQQGVIDMEAGSIQQAADTFMRVVAEAPASAIRVSAQRDAAALLMQSEQWQRAIDVMSDFQQRFPGHEETAAIPARLLLANQSLGNWSGAAEQAMVMAKQDDDPKVRQQALYSAAEYYQQADDIDNAIAVYKQYAHTYSSPTAETLPQTMEAQYRLTELYAGQGLETKREFWLNKLIATHQSAAEPTDRSRYLAAFAATDFAEKKMAVYRNISLKHPLKKSLAKKQKAMKVALQRYEAVAEYDVEAFSTQATFRIGEIYASLARDLLASERPKGLNELELEQYDFLLEEQAYPFEESAIEFYTVNIERAWRGIYGEWISASYQALATLMPARFDKTEMRPQE